MTTSVILKKNKGIIEIHFDGDVDFIAGWELTSEFFDKKVDMIAYSSEFLRAD